MIFEDLGAMTTNGLRELMPLAMDEGAVEAVTELLWELNRRAEDRTDLDGRQWLDARVGFYGDAFRGTLERVRRLQRAGLNQDGFDAAGIWQGWAHG